MNDTVRANEFVKDVLAVHGGGLVCIKDHLTKFMYNSFPSVPFTDDMIAVVVEGFSSKGFIATVEVVGDAKEYQPLNLTLVFK